MGRRTGHSPLEGALIEYIGLRGDLCGIDTAAITEVADFYRSIGTPVPDRYPLVGADFAKTRAGIHADGLKQDERIYSIFDTTALLGRPPEIVVTDKSGSDGVQLWVNRYLGRDGQARLKKTRLLPIMQWVNEQYEVHRQTTAISDREMADLVRRHLPEEYERARREGRLAFPAESQRQ